jgi:hypothetical protein
MITVGTQETLPGVDLVFVTDTRAISSTSIYLQLPPMAHY